MTSEKECPNFSFSLRSLRVSCVTAVNDEFKYSYRGDAEIAEVTQRIIIEHYSPEALLDDYHRGLYT